MWRLIHPTISVVGVGLRLVGVLVDSTSDIKSGRFAANCKYQFSDITDNMSDHE